MSAGRIVRFGTFEFDFSSGELRNNGRLVPLQSQPARVLAQLLSNPGQIVTRKELCQTVWADDTFVEFDTALNVAVNKVRQALRDSASAPRFIETIPKGGYRFLADVRPVEPSGSPIASPAPVAGADGSRPVRRLWTVGLALAVALAVLAIRSAWPLSGNSRPEERSASPRSLAVLPFQPVVAETRDEALEVGLAEAVIIKLGELKQLRVPSIQAVQRYARLQADPLVAGRALGVDAVLEGSLLRVNGNVRLSARLLDVEKGTTLWAQQWDVPWTDIFTVQDAVATQVSRALSLSLGTEDTTSFGRHPTTVAAYDPYLRARFLLTRRTIAESKRAITLLEQATSFDPASSAAHASLGFAYISVPLLDGPTRPYVALGKQAAVRAVELDRTNAEARGVLGRIRFQFEWDSAGAEQEFRRALELEPNDPFVLHCFSLILAEEGRFDEALALADRALARDPASVIANRDKGIILFLARRYEESVQQHRRALELDPYYISIYPWLALAYDRLERSEEAVEAHIAPLTFSEANRGVVAALRDAARHGGLEGFWKRRLQFLLEEPEVPMGTVALAYTNIGDHDRALAWLEQVFAERGAYIRTLKRNPRWDPLRNDARFQDLVRRANVPQPPMANEEPRTKN